MLSWLICGAVEVSVSSFLSFLGGVTCYMTSCFPMQGIALVVLVIHTFFPLSYEGSYIYWRNTVNQLKVFCCKIFPQNMFSDFISLWRKCPIHFSSPFLYRMIFFLVTGIDLSECNILQQWLTNSGDNNNEVTN